MVMDRAANRKFGLLMCAVLIIIGTIPILRGNSPRIYLLIPAFIFMLIALISPDLLSPVYKGWMKFSHQLGKVNSIIILSVVYFLVLLPIGISLKLFSNNYKKFQFKPDKDSYWIKKQHINSSENMERLF